MAAIFPVFLVSSLYHDYHVSMGVGFFAPVFIVMFAGAGGTPIFLCLSDSSQLPITAICIVAIQLKVYGLLEEEVLQQLGPAIN